MFTSAPAVGPGIFSLPDGSPAVQHGADFSPVTRANPISAGENIVIYGTGFGRLNASGSLLAGNPLVTIGQSSCRVLYAGAAPGSVGGYQVNCQVGSDVQSGDQSLKITYNPLHLIVSPASFAINSNVVTVPVK